MLCRAIQIYKLRRGYDTFSSAVKYGAPFLIFERSRQNLFPKRCQRMPPHFEYEQWTVSDINIWRREDMAQRHAPDLTIYRRLSPSAAQHRRLSCSNAAARMALSLSSRDTHYYYHRIGMRPARQPITVSFISVS